MNRIFSLIAILVILVLSSCTWNNNKIVKPDNTATHADPEKLYKEKQYDNALMAMLKADPKLLENPSARKLLWRINDRIVTTQWYLQKSIVELSKGNKGAARKHVNEALKLYPGHKPSLLLSRRLDSIHLKNNHKTPKFSKTAKKNNAAGKEPSKANLNLANYYLMAGNAYFEDGQLTLAKASWLRGLDIIPSHSVIKKNLIKLLTNEGLQLFGQGHIKASIEKWEEGLKINPDDSEIKSYLDKARKAEKKIRSID